MGKEGDDLEGRVARLERAIGSTGLSIHNFDDTEQAEAYAKQLEEEQADAAKQAEEAAKAAEKAEQEAAEASAPEQETETTTRSTRGGKS